MAINNESDDVNESEWNPNESYEANENEREEFMINENEWNPNESYEANESEREEFTANEKGHESIENRRDYNLKSPSSLVLNNTSNYNAFYKKLEIKKILQIHHKIPTTFVLPLKNLEFVGISYKIDENLIGRSEEFILKKDRIEETWKIKKAINFKNTVDHSEDTVNFEDTKIKNIADILLKEYL